MGKWMRGLVALLVLFCLCTWAGAANGAFAPRTVEVAIFNVPYFSEKQPDGSYKGIVIDYLRELSKYAGWDVQYIEGDIANQASMFENEQIDLIGGVLKNAYTQEWFVCADLSSGYSYTTLKALAGNEAVQTMDYSTFQGKRVGILKKAVNRIPFYEAFLADNSLEMQTIYYDSSDALTQALSAGEVDMIVSNDTSLAPGEKTVAKFGAVPYYFAAKKNNPALLHELNAALNTLVQVNPNFAQQVYERHIGSLERDFVLTGKERAFVQDAGTIRVAMLPKFAPISFYDAQSGALDGVATEILQYISEQTGLRFQMVLAADMARAQALLESGKVDMLADFGELTAGNAAALQFTRSYMSTQMLILRNGAVKEAGRGLAAMPIGFGGFPAEIGAAVREYDSVEACIRAVASGKAEYTMLSGLLIDQYPYLRADKHMALTPITRMDGGLRFALSKQANPLLLSVLDRSISSLDDAKIQQALYQHTGRENLKTTFSMLVYSNPLAVVAIIAAVCLALVITVVLILLYMRAMRERMNTDYLTQLPNRQCCERQIGAYFEDDRGGVQGALLVMDIDEFKNINDTLGHLAGDQVLRSFGRLLTKEFAGEDVAGRWGGDEFIAYLRHAPDRAQIALRAQRLCEGMGEEFHYGGHSRKLSISIGIALAEDASDFAALFQKADQALYAIKTTTRNGFLIQ